HIVSLSAEKNNQTVVLKWQAASESAGSSFTVERSTNGVSFSSLGMVKASTTSTSLHAYSFVDNAPAGGMNYYRLKVADGSSKIFYTNIVAVDYSLAESIRIFPNPVHDVLFVKGISPDARAEIADASGKTVLQTQMNAGNSIQLQHLQKGLYFLRITDGGKTTVLKFMKE
ncbi:MAG TPA: T9SS type A sorting domain-containing protein, partial [Chitinophagaceae bacterium]|nr:T9SS type A sorting domain-containing protein [Chitinophagaceae bacterium]